MAAGEWVRRDAGVEGGSCSPCHECSQVERVNRGYTRRGRWYIHIVNTYIEANVKEGSADLLQPQPPVGEFEVTS